MSITVKEIVKEYLESHGFDGLCDEDCGCFTDDLCPCGGGEWTWGCMAGYAVEENDIQFITAEKPADAMIAERKKEGEDGSLL